MFTICLAVLIGFSAAADLQQPRGTHFGASVLALSDLDGDGVCDIAVGAPAYSPNAGPKVLWPGGVFVLSGATRKPITIWSGEPGYSRFGSRLRNAGDVNGDGIDDLLVGYEAEKRTDLRSGKDGSLLQGFDYPDREVEVLGDLDKDGRPDIVLRKDTNLEVRSGKTGEVLIKKSSTMPGSDGWWVGDHGGEGLLDLVWFNERTMLLHSSRVPKDCAGPHSLFQTGHTLDLGVDLSPGSATRVENVTRIGDLDGDAKPEWIIWVDEKRKGRGIVVSSKKGKPLFTLATAKTNFVGHGWFGYSSVAGLDANADGTMDIAAADPIDLLTNTIRVYSGKDGHALWERKIPEANTLSGLSLALGPDANGDGVCDLLVGSSPWGWSAGDYGRGDVYLLSGKTGKELWRVTGSDCVAKEPQEK